MVRQASSSVAFSRSPSSALYAATHAGEMASPNRSAQNAAKLIFRLIFIDISVLSFGDLAHRDIERTADIPGHPPESQRERGQPGAVDESRQDLQNRRRLVRFLVHDASGLQMDLTQALHPQTQTKTAENDSLCGRDGFRAAQVADEARNDFLDRLVYRLRAGNGRKFAGLRERGDAVRQVRLLTRSEFEQVLSTSRGLARRRATLFRSWVLLFHGLFRESTRDSESRASRIAYVNA